MFDITTGNNAARCSPMPLKGTRFRLGGAIRRRFPCELCRAGKGLAPEGTCGDFQRNEKPSVTRELLSTESKYVLMLKSFLIPWEP